MSLRAQKMIRANFYLIAILGLTTACQKSDDAPAKSVARVFHQLDKPVTADNYLNGKAFCEEYKEITSKEYGRFVSVPVDYSSPGEGSLDIYAWTERPFNPELPTVVMVDGGPGQNTHDFGDSLNSDWNEIHFDQRGLGCSSLGTFEKYKDPKYFSTANTVRDMDEIRKAYNIKKWSVFGVSYGTVPATEYGSQYSKHTVAVTLEGTLYSVEDVHSTDWRVAKWNLILSKLTTAQVKSFGKVLAHKSYQELILLLFTERIYADNGFTKVLTDLKKLISTDGVIDYALLDKAAESAMNQIDKDNSGPHARFAQKPLGVDSQIFSVIFCKDLGYELLTTGPDYDFENNQFVVRSYKTSSTCKKMGINSSQQRVYTASDYPVSVPISYFQGSHDGATLARGAFKHYRYVPKGIANFILNKKGGHNPLSLSVVDLERHGREKQSKDSMDAHRELFAKTLRGEKIKEWDLTSPNFLRSLSTENLGLWTLIDYSQDGKNEFEKQLEGIRQNPRSQPNLLIEP